MSSQGEVADISPARDPETSRIAIEVWTAALAADPQPEHNGAMGIAIGDAMRNHPECNEEIAAKVAAMVSAGWTHDRHYVQYVLGYTIQRYNGEEIVYPPPGNRGGPST